MLPQWLLDRFLCFKFFRENAFRKSVAKEQEILNVEKSDPKAVGRLL